MNPRLQFPGALLRSSDRIKPEQGRKAAAWSWNDKEYIARVAGDRNVVKWVVNNSAARKAGSIV